MVRVVPALPAAPDGPPAGHAAGVPCAAPTDDAAGAAVPGVPPAEFAAGVPLIAVYLVWGSTYLAMRFALVGFPPLLLAAARFLLAGGALLVGLAARGGVAALPDRRQWLTGAPIGLLLFLCGNGFVSIAEVHIGSGMAAVVVATMPLWMAILAALGGERPAPREWLGLALGFGAVAVLSSGADLQASPRATLFLLLSPVCWAAGSTLARRVSPAPAGRGRSRTAPVAPMRELLAAAAAQMVVGGLGALVVGLAAGERMTAVPGARPLLAVAYLVAAGSLIGFTSYSWLLRNTRPALATSYAFVNPVLAVLLGVVIAAEPLRWQSALATPMVAVSVALVVTARAARTAVTGQIGDTDEPGGAAAIPPPGA